MWRHTIFKNTYVFFLIFTFIFFLLFLFYSSFIYWSGEKKPVTLWDRKYTTKFMHTRTSTNNQSRICMPFWIPLIFWFFFEHEMFFVKCHTFSIQSKRKSHFLSTVLKRVFLSSFCNLRLCEPSSKKKHKTKICTFRFMHGFLAPSFF